MDIKIIGGGLAGCEAAWQAAKEGCQVTLYEMKPKLYSPAHQSENLAELVCSNSLRGAGMNNAVGCLKEELRRCDSLFIELPTPRRFQPVEPWPLTVTTFLPTSVKRSPLNQASPWSEKRSPPCRMTASPSWPADR